MTSDSLARTVETFLAGSCHAVVLENGIAAFDLSESRYSISGEHHKCLLHLWSADRSLVRRVLNVETRKDVLRLDVQRMGAAKATKLEICRELDRRSPTAKKAARTGYLHKLQRVLERQYPNHVVGRLSSTADLKRSLSPVYARGVVKQGQTAFAVMGVNADETQASVDACLTFGLLWLDACRQQPRMVISGLRLFLPPGTSAVARSRMGHLDRGAGRFELYEFDERELAVSAMDLEDRGNIATRLVHATDEAAARDRFREAIEYVRRLYPEVELSITGPAEISFRCFGLEFARARLGHEAGSLRPEAQLVFGLGAGETVVNEDTSERFRALVHSIAEVRHAGGPHDHAGWRMHPERWLESLTVRDVRVIDERLDEAAVYSQVPAFSASDRAMIDVLSVTREGRLAVIELKADEDLHLPLQGLDYWQRVAWHHRRGEFKSFGYFPGRELSAASPLLYLVAPALHVHPATDTILKYLSADVPWVMAAIDERWRERVRVVFRKRPAKNLEGPASGRIAG